MRVCVCACVRASVFGRFKDRLRLGQVQSDNEKLVTKYGVKKFPQVASDLETHATGDGA